ncbi:transcription factor MYBS3 isoform X2 [Argentina anserina]|uniref:transcription factor MYBS3 isoform X2 n=1 Tax=Argentina anserina TaxID=57926 RepID=UPI0021766E2E|nr:transcription factor MYBS3 isoform X2 [Potentilla anserina]
MGRKCSHCGNIGHNSRTCTNFGGSSTAAGFVGTNGFRLFGVQVHNLDHISSSVSSFNAMNMMMMKKSFSMDCLPTSSASSSSPSSSRVSIDNENSDHHKAPIGYLSDGLICRAQDRKKGVPWTEEEHRTFLMGLEKLGKGDWRGISRNYVTTRTPTQVASHAQKYFLRQATLTKKKRRSSLFDMFGSKSCEPQSKLRSIDPAQCVNSIPSSPQHQNLQLYTTTDITSASQNLKLFDRQRIPADYSDYIPPLGSSYDRDRDRARDHSMPGWIYGLIDSQLKFSNAASSLKPSTSTIPPPPSSSVVPDHLELTLAAPVRPLDLDQNRSSSSPTSGPLLNTISVT